MWPAKFKVHGVIRVLPTPVRGFLRHCGIFCFLDCTTVKPVIGYLTANQSLEIDWNVSGSAFYFTYSWDTGAVHPFYEFRSAI